MRFFSSLAERTPIPVPACHHAADDATSQFVVVMEDLSHLRVVDQTAGCPSPTPSGPSTA